LRELQTRDTGKKATCSLPRPTAQPKIKVSAKRDKEFFLKVVEAQLTFVTGPDGKATSVILHQGGRHQEAKRVP